MGSLHDLLEKINPVVNSGTAPKAPVSLGARIYYGVKPFYNLIFIIVVGAIFFTIGRISSLEKQHTPIKIEYPNQEQSSSVIQSISTTSVAVSPISKPKTTNITTSTSQSAPQTSGEVIGSKSGKKYYFPWCGTVKRILPQNQVHFASIEEARAAGFTAGGNCKGLK